jgi:hypothetical protein
LRRTIGCLLLTLLLTSCSWSDRVSPGAFEWRARAMATRWQGSPIDQAWREGFVPLAGLEVVPRWERVPAWAALSLHNGAWDLGAELPAGSPARMPLHWPDGAVSEVPLITAATAYARLGKPADFIDEECPRKGCRRLRMTGVELGEAALTTSRGTIRVPAWHFTAKGVKERFVVVAVDPSATTPRPRAAKGGREEVRAFDPMPGDPHELLVTYGYGSCDHVHGTRAYESDDVVVVDVDEEGSGGMCNLMLLLGRATVTLTRPLGDRVVLDSGSGLPVLRGRSVP